MTEFQWVSIGFAGVIVLAWVLDWFRWEPKAGGRDREARRHRRPHDRAG